MGCSKSSLKREVYSNTILPQEKEKHQTLPLKQLEKQEEKKNQQKDRNQRSEQKEMKETIVKMNKNIFEKINKIDKP